MEEDSTLQAKEMLIAGLRVDLVVGWIKVFHQILISEWSRPKKKDISLGKFR